MESLKVMKKFDCGKPLEVQDAHDVLQPFGSLLMGVQQFMMMKM
jgi:hypothetical protein